MNPINVKIKLEDGGILPAKATPGAAAYDVYLPQMYIVETGRSVLPLNFRIELPDGYEALIEPRSGFSSKGMEGYISIKEEDGRIIDSAGHGRFDCDVMHGKIDSDYRGIVGVIVNNRDRRFTLPKGMRIAQMTLRKVENATFIQVDALSETERGDGGFGHSLSM